MAEACWRLPASQLDDQTPLRVRDLVVECFYVAQHETLRRTKAKLGVAGIDDASIRANVVGAVRFAFKESDGDFDHPTAASLRNAVGVLASRAESWGTPVDIIQQHHEQVLDMLRRLEPAA